MEYKDCSNCRYNQENLTLPTPAQCKKCKVKAGTLTPTQWRLVSKKLDKRFYVQGQINFPALRDAIREAMHDRCTSDQQFQQEYGKAINTVLKWIVARKIERKNYDALCTWIKCSKTIFINKMFKKRMPYYAKSEHCRMAGRAGK
jgi:hypothetical protein